MSRTLSTADVSRIVGLSEAQVRSFVRSGLCTPGRRGRRYAFSFQDLVVLYAARGLLERRVPAARIRRALAHLADELPADRPLSGLRIFADGRQVAVREGGTAWQAETGQTLLDFEVDTLAEQVADLPERGGGGDDAQAHFERALDAEDEDPRAAALAYREALRADPELVDAYVNLGRLLHDAGQPVTAIRLYHEAATRAPEDPVVPFNLALAVEDTQGAAAALPHYRRVLELDPDFADAHYNLAGVCERLGRKSDALRHYHAYKKLTES